MPVTPRDPEERFWEKVGPPTAAGCLPWEGATTPKGYGRFWFGGRTAMAHRFAYELIHGPVPEGLVIDHLCRVRHCVNAEHLEAVTPRENVVRGDSPALMRAFRSGLSACQQGHEFTTENTRIGTGGRRVCRTCERAYQRVWKRAKRKSRAKTPPTAGSKKDEA